MSRQHAYRGRRVVVLGARGFIGQWTARKLREAGAELWLGVRAGESAAPPEERTCPVALEREGAAAELLLRIRPDITFNLAGYGVYPEQDDPALAQRLNVELPGELAATLATVPNGGWTGQRLVHAGSAAEYGSAGGDLVESTEPQPLSLYGRTKLAGSRSVLAASAAHGLPAVVARLFTVYGPGERGDRLLPTLLRAAQHQDPIPLTAGEQQRDFTYVEDVAEGLLRLGALPGEPLGLLNLATGTLLSVRSFVERAAAVLGIAEDRLRFGTLPTRPNEMRHASVSIARLQHLCDWSPPTGIEEGVRRSRAAS